MSTVSKIFIVLNFLVAIMFMTASLTLYAKKVHWVEDARLSAMKRNELEKQKQVAEETLARVEKSLGEEKIRLEDLSRTQQSELDRRQSRIASLEQEKNMLHARLGDIQDKIAAVESQLATQQEDIRNLRTQNEDLRARTDRAEQARAFAEAQSIEVVSDLKEAEAELLELSKKTHSLMNRVLEQDVLLDEAQKRGFNPTLLANATPATPIAGKVLQVEESVGIVILNVGEKNQVKPGMEFVISRGAEYVGKVRIRNTYEDMSSATIIRPLQKAPIEVADTAQTM